MHHINPLNYAKTRNFGNGSVTHLSPYISRGVLSTLDVYRYLKQLEKPWNEIEKLIQELAWRDYFQQVWLAKGSAIHIDLKNEQTPIANYQIPKAIVNATTGIEVIDKAIEEFYQTGYLHNHLRMYIASISCNLANSHWLQPSKWMYAHLLDGDIASNQLSWQWVAGTFSNKKYIANQDNINKFFHSSQKGTFLDVSYERLSNIKTPQILLKTIPFQLKTELPNLKSPSLDSNKKTLIYNYYNLDPNWYKNEDFQRIFLVEPSIFEKYPVEKKCIDFAIELSKNIPEIKIVVGEFNDLVQKLNPEKIIFKEHPLNLHYIGKEESRDWLCNVKGYFPSFFAFWKKCKKELLS